jgi:hypothetical protein
MLIILPLLLFLAIFMDFIGFQSHLPTRFLVRKAFLQTTLSVGVWIGVSSEILSLFNSLNSFAVTIGWTGLLILSLVLGLRKGWLRMGFLCFRNKLKQIDRYEVLTGVGLILVLSLLFIILYLAPPNNTDSLQYHMSRVMHWVQNQSLRHYPTGFEPQLTNPIWAEEGILHLRLLWGDDRLAELVQLFAMIGCMVGVSFLAGLLGANRRGQLAAVIFSAGIPMGIMQATSTQNDYATALWLVSLACWTVLVVQKEVEIIDLIFLASALGLGLLTKGTFYPYAIPLILWLFISLLKKVRLLRTVKIGLLLACIVLILNAGYWWRNIVTFGGPLGPTTWVGSMTGSGTGIGYLGEAVIRNVVMNFATPYEEINTRVSNYLYSTFGSFNPALKGFIIRWGWNHEDTAENPLHILWVPVTLIILLIYRRKVERRQIFWYTGVGLGMFIAMAVIVRIDPYGIRYQLPFFVTWAPVFGCAISLLNKPRLTLFITLALFLLIFPWVLFNRSRPLIAMENPPGRFAIPCDWHFGCTARSLLSEPQVSFLFINNSSAKGPYLEMAKTISSSACRNVGLRIDSHDPEYIFWWILSAPQSRIRIETIYSFPELDRYRDKAYKPCTIICTICENRQQLHGLTLQGVYDNVRLFSGNNYVDQP